MLARNIANAFSTIGRDLRLIGCRNWVVGSLASLNQIGQQSFGLDNSLDLTIIKSLTVSVDISYTNARRLDVKHRFYRIGFEIRLLYTDDTCKYVGAWQNIKAVANAQGENFTGRICESFRVPADKTIKAIDVVFMQIINIQADSMMVKNPKLEVGTIATDYAPAVGDYRAIYHTTTAQSPNVFVGDDGVLCRSVSSQAYKQIIGDLVLDDTAYKNAMNLAPIIYRSIADNDNPNWHYYSFSAQVLGDYDKAFALWREPIEQQFDDKGVLIAQQKQPPIAEGINLNAIVAFLHAINVKQGKLIKELEKRLASLEKRLMAIDKS